jgi:hypothetical protein
VEISRQTGNVDLSGTLYRQTITNAVVNALDPAAVLGLPSTYLAASAAALQSPFVCGSGATLSNVYLRSAVSGVGRIYQGAHLSATMHPDRRATITMFFDATGAYITGTDARLTDPLALVTPGRQMPNVAPFDAGAVLSYELRPRGTAGSIALHWTSANNQQNLPAMLLADIGLSAHAGNGTFSAAITNVTNEYAGTLVSPRFAVPLRAANGAPVSILAVPNPPRSVYAAYSLTLGRGATPQDTAGGTSKAVPFLPLPPVPPSRALEVNASAPTCTAGLAKQAAPLLDAFRKEVATIEARRGSGDAESSPAIEQNVPGISLTYHANHGSYALTIETTRFDVLQAVGSCIALHVGTSSQARDMGLYTPQYAPSVAHPELVYAPEAGFYLLTDLPAKPKSDTAYRFYQVASEPPAVPFAATASAACPAETLAIAQRSLNAFTAQFEQHKPLPPEEWALDTFGHGGSAVYHLRPTRSESYDAVLRCAHVVAVNAAEARSFGYATFVSPVIGFSRRIGLFVVITSS